MRHVAGAPGGVDGAQSELQLGVVVTGKTVQFAGAGHFVAHLGEFRRAVDGVGKGLRFHDELGILDVIERTRPVGQLNTGLKRVVALAGHGHFPMLAGNIQAFNGKGLAPCAASGGHGGQRGIARNRAFQRDGSHDVNQGVQTGFFLGRGNGELGSVKTGFYRACVTFRHSRRRGVSQRSGVVARFGLGLARCVFA